MSDSSPLDILLGETEQMNPAILLAEEFMRRDAADLMSAEDINRTEEVLAIGRSEIETIRRQEATFARSAATSSTALPVGF